MKNYNDLFSRAGAYAVLSGLVLMASFTSCSSSSQKGKTDDEPVLQIGDSIAIANTAYGKVKGYILNDTYTFLGIPYGANTGSKNRFMPAQEPESWEGIKPTVYYGNSAPQRIYNRGSDDYQMFVDHWNYDEVSENCLSLNVWTQGIADGAKRPVLVWLHGGGYSNGNAIEQDGYHGENLSRYGNIVFCSVNHRLGPIGFTDLSGAGGEKYKDSGNVGILDIVAALRWIHNNIENFGGDPNNVTIMGQSGGGAKVCTLLAMDETKGLIHKAVALSGNTTGAINPEYSKKLGEYIVKEAGLKPSQIDKLQEIPWNEYLNIAYRAADKLAKENVTSGMRRGGFGPVADGIHIPQETFYSNPDAPSASVPLIVCTTFNESSPSRTDAVIEKITMEQVVEKLKPSKGDKAEAIVKAYVKAFPDKKPIEIYSMILSSRRDAVNTANAKLKQQAPVYMAWFGWQPPLFDGRMRAFHCLDISFWFRNTDRIVTHTGGGARPRVLADKMSDALLNFMRTGNPSCSALPAWPKYTEANGEVMILDDQCEVKNDPDREAREIL